MVLLEITSGERGDLPRDSTPSLLACVGVLVLLCVLDILVAIESRPF